MRGERTHDHGGEVQDTHTGEGAVCESLCSCHDSTSKIQILKHREHRDTDITENTEK